MKATLLRAVSTIFICALGALSHAQESGGQGGLSLGETVNNEPQVGQAYVQQNSGDWEIRCVKSRGDVDPCQLYQLLEDQNGNPVAEFTMFNVPPGGAALAGGNIITPLETLLTASLTMSVDGGETKRYPFTFCTRGGCVSRIGFTASDINAFQRGNEAILTIYSVSSPDTPVNLSLSLAGFTVGFDAMLDSAP